MNNTKSRTAAIVIIGNEILSGRTQDVNIAHISQKLNNIGVYVMEARIIPDVEDMIVETVLHCHRQYDYVFTTGGIGPTHDDITATSISKAFGREVEFNEKSVEIMKRRYGDKHLLEGRMNMARMPKGAELIRNPVSSVPGFQIENVYVMAGIPDVMRGMLDSVLEKLTPGDPILSYALHSHVIEGDLAPGLRDIQNANPSVDIGSYPFWKLGKFGTSVVVRSQDWGLIEAVIEQVKALMISLGGEPESETEL